MMDKNTLNKLLEELDSQMNGDADHDSDVLIEWIEGWGSDPDAEPLIRELFQRYFELITEEDGEDIGAQIINEMISDVDKVYDKACSLVSVQRYEEVVRLLSPLVEKIRDFPLPNDKVWMDFNSYLDSFLYQDYFEDEIAEREIRRHPLRPGRILFMMGSTLIELGRADEALDPLRLLLSYDPVCPKYLFEYGEACKRTGRLQEAYNTAMQALFCASNRVELARAYRDIGYCMAESGLYENAVSLYMLSLSFQPSSHADAEIAWIRKKTGISSENCSRESILKLCGELNIPVGINETVQQNLDLLNGLMEPTNE